MSNPDAFANSLEPELPGLARPPMTEEADAAEVQDQADQPVHDDFVAASRQPETQGENPGDAELGAAGEGDLTPGDEPDTSGADEPTDLRDAAE